jgi:DNA-binding LytR/AlgR family response regulator
MNILIIEDEEQAARRLMRMMRKLKPDAFLHGPLQSVKGAVEWMEQNPSPDLMLLDIHLGDGLSFEIFEKVKTPAPVIFTTAYDQYAIKAFKLNSIDYLLKPIQEDELLAAMNKFRHNSRQNLEQRLGKNWHRQLGSDVENKYKQRFLTRVGDKLNAVETEHVLYGYSENKATYLVTGDGRRYLIDFSLEQLESVLNPDDFFRLNRKYISRYAPVEKMLSYSNSRLKVKLQFCDDEDIVLSRDKTREFKEWLDR